MNEAFVEHDPDGYRVYRHIGDLHKQRVGPAWKSPRAAVDYANRLDIGVGVSPLPTPRPAQDAPLPARIGSPVVVTNERD